MSNNIKFEKDLIASYLDRYHSLFRLFWDYGNVVFSEAHPTAWVEFDDKGGCINFCFNPNYYKSLSDYKKAFITAHEMMHIMLEHNNVRDKDYMNDMDRLNKAEDIVVNHLLVDQFGFQRDLVENWKNYCWIDTLFDSNQYVEKDRAFDYYYELLGSSSKKTGSMTLDIHGVGDGSGTGFNSITDAKNEHLQNIISQLVSTLPAEELQALKDALGENLNSQAGVGTGSWVNLDAKPVAKKKKWESVIKRWEKLHRKEFDKQLERWDRKDRRYHNILDNKPYFLPADMTLEESSFKENKIDVFFFLDTSGSCWGLKDRFFKAAKSLDPRRFNIRLFCFDTDVKETTLESGRIYGGGGTAFDIIENHIQNVIRTEKKKYPKAVFLITDGYGTPVNPEYPDRWYWFLSADYRSYIPKESKIFMLENYE